MVRARGNSRVPDGQWRLPRLHFPDAALSQPYRCDRFGVMLGARAKAEWLRLRSPPFSLTSDQQ